MQLEWDSNLLHLFFSADVLHERMSEDIHLVPFETWLGRLTSIDDPRMEKLREVKTSLSLG